MHRPMLNRSTRFGALAFLATLAACSPQRGQAQAQPPAQVSAQTIGTYAIEGVNIIPMNREVELSDYTVIVRDGRITEISPRASITVPAQATRINGRGKYLLPGFHDMHAHLSPGVGEQMDGVVRQMSIYLSYGVTSVRALAAPPTGFQVKRKLESGALLGPRLWVAGQSVNGQTAPTIEAVNALVTQMATLGADVVKTHGGFPSIAEYQALASAARRHNLPLAGHVSAEFGVEGAVAAGMQIEHLDGMIAAAVPAGTRMPPGNNQFPLSEEVLEMVDSARVDSLARVMAAKKIYHGPTLALFQAIGGNDPPEFFLNRPDTMFTPKPALSQWSLQRRNQLQAPISAEVRTQFLEVRNMIVRRLQAAGVPLLAGSDGPQFFMVVGFGLHRELEAFVDAGLTPYQALLTATATPATYLGRGAQAGTIEVGKDADLVLLDANPLDQITNTMRVHGTMVRGQWLDREKLDQLQRAVRETIERM